MQTFFSVVGWLRRAVVFPRIGAHSERQPLHNVGKPRAVAPGEATLPFAEKWLRQGGYLVRSRPVSLRATGSRLEAGRVASGQQASFLG